MDPTRKRTRKKWLIIETNRSEYKESMKTDTLVNIMHIIQNIKLTNKIEWLAMIRAHLERLIKMGHGEKIMQMKIKLTPKQQEKTNPCEMSILRTANDSTSYEEESYYIDEYSEDEFETSGDYEELTDKLQYLLEDLQEQEGDELTHNLTEEYLLEDHIENKVSKVPRKIKLSEKEIEDLLNPVPREIKLSEKEAEELDPLSKYGGELIWLRTETYPPKVFTKNVEEICFDEAIEPTTNKTRVPTSTRNCISPIETTLYD